MFFLNRKTKLLVQIIIICFIFSLLSPSINGFAQGDTTPPVLNSLVITTNNVKVGDPIAFRADISDSLSGVKFAYVRYSYDGVNKSVSLTKNLVSGLFEGTLTFNQYDPAGTWEVWDVFLGDNQGNQVFIHNGTGTPDGSYEYRDLSAYNINLTNMLPGDTSPPVLNNLSISSTNVKVGDPITFRADISDSLSGVQFAYVRYSCDGVNKSVSLTKNSVSGLFEGTLIFNQYDPAGTWEVWDVFLGDNQGNQVFIHNGTGTPDGSYEYRDLSAYNINLTNMLPGDTSPPVLNNLSISSTNVKVGDPITFRADISDSLSGVQFAYVRYSCDDVNKSVSLTKNSVSGLFEGTLIFNQYDPAGTWDVWDVFLGDKQGNQVFIHNGTGTPDGSYEYRDLSNYNIQVSNGLTYSVRFDSQCGSAVPSKTGTYGNMITAPTAPTKTGYSFGGWYKEVACINAWNFTTDTIPANNITLFAKWNINQYTISFNSNGGSSVGSITQNVGTNVVKPADPTKVGYSFGGWYSDSALTNAYTFTTMPANNVQLYAKWNLPVTDVTPPVISGMTWLATELHVGEQLNIEIDAYDSESGIIKDGYYVPKIYIEHSVTGIYKAIDLTYDEATRKFRGSFTITSDMQAGKWVLDFISIQDNVGNQKYYRPSDFSQKYEFNLIGGSTDITPPVISGMTWSATELNVGEQLLIEVEAYDLESGIIKDGYYVPKIYIEHSVTGIYKAIDLMYDEATRKFRGSFTITSDMQAGKWVLDFISIQDNVGNQKYYRPSDFSQKYEFNLIELTTNTISFNSNGGSSVENITQNIGTNVVKPVDPTKVGYTFGGWYSDSALTNAYTFTTMPANNVQLYAKWTVNQYTITFDSNGGSSISSKTGTFGSTITAPTTPTKTGYTFGGWYKEATCTNVWNFAADRIPGNNVTLYAKWIDNNSILKPAAPSSLWGTQIGSIQITISWTPVAGADSYNIYHWNGWDDLKKVNSLPITSNTFIDTVSKDIHSKDYYYVVTAVNSAGESEYSQYTRVPFIITTPSAPANMTTTVVNPNTIKLTWSQQQDADYFEVICYKDSDLNWYIPSYTTYSNSYVIGGLSSNNTYHFKVRALNAAGWSSYSLLDMALVTGTVSNVSKNGFDINFNQAIFGLTASNFNLNNEATIDQVSTTDNGLTYHVIANLTPNQTYTANVTKTGYAFTLGNNVGNVVVPADPITYIVSFNSNGGSNVASQAADYDSIITAPIAPTKTGYLFFGWYKDSTLTSPWDFATDNVTANVMLYAKWSIKTDNTVPVISGTTSKTIALNDPFNPLTGITAFDNVDGNITNLINVTGSINVSVKGVYTLTYTVSDKSGNVKTATRIITVDNTAPTISGATGKTIAMNSTFDPKAGVTASDNLDGNITNLISVAGSVNTSVKGVYTLTYTVSDKSGNVKTVTRTIIVDNTAPVISGTTSKTIAMNSTFDPKAGVTASDNLDGNITNLINVTGSVNTSVKGVYTLTYTVSDRSGNIKTATRTITVDNTAPTISGTTSKTIALNSTFDPKAGVTASDNLDGNITSLITVIGSVGVGVKGVYTLTYTVSDRSGNVKTVTRTITVDNTAPVISGTTNKTIALNSMFDPKAGVTASDNLDGNITGLITVTGSANVNVKGVYTLTYTVSDRSGNIKTATRTITVDNTAPTISGTTSKTIALNSAFDPKAGVTASDNLDGNITGLITVTGSVNVNVKGVYTLTYTVSDRSGNIKTATRTITVDNTAPTISGTTSKTIALNSTFDPKAGVTASDNLDGNLTSLITVTGLVDVRVRGVYTLTYTVSDRSGNIKTVTRTITVDNTAPTISGTTSKTIALNSTFDPKAGVTASDNIDGNITNLISVTGFVNVNVRGVYTLTYTVSDRSGNVKTVTRTITVDNTAPTISGTTSKTIALNSTFDPKAGVTASDNIDGNITNLINVTGLVNVNVKGVYTLTYTVSDRSGNVKTVNRTITVK